MKEIILNGESLTFEQVVAVSGGEPDAVRVVLSDEAKNNVNRSANAVQILLERGEIVSKEASKEMLDILKRQQYKDGIGRGLLDTVPSASSGARRGSATRCRRPPRWTSAPGSKACTCSAGTSSSRCARG